MPGSIRPGARRCTRSALSIWRCGTSRARRSACRCTSCSAAAVRNYLRVLRHGRICPAHGWRRRMPLRDRARATMEAGYRAFRMGAGGYRSRRRLQHTRARCARSRRIARTLREGVGPNGDWCIDFHQRFDLFRRHARVPADRGISNPISSKTRFATRTHGRTSRSCVR